MCGASLLLLMAGGCRGPLLGVEDAVRLDGGPTRLAAYVEWEPVITLRADLVGVPVEFFVNGRAVGRATTDDRGAAELDLPVTVAGETFEARARVRGRDLHAAGRINDWPSGRMTIVLDVDHTIEDTDYSDLLLTSRIPRSRPFPESVRVLGELARDYNLVYLTGRPRTLLEQTRGWLERSGYPPAPVIVAKGVREMLFQGTFKKVWLAVRQAEWPTMLIGIGDKTIDADAYGYNHMLSIMVKDGGTYDYGPHSIVLRDWTAVEAFFRDHAAELRDPVALRTMIAARQPLFERWRAERKTDDYQGLTVMPELRPVAQAAAERREAQVREFAAAAGPLDVTRTEATAAAADRDDDAGVRTQVVGGP